MLFTEYLYSSQCPLGNIGSMLSQLDLRARKTFLTVLRCQSIPVKGSKLYTQIIRGLPDYEDLFYASPGGVYYSLPQIIDSLHDYILEPIANGFLQMVIKTLPLEDEEVEEAIRKGYEKEILASQERRFRPMINLQSILTPHSHQWHFHPLVSNWKTFSPQTHRYIYFLAFALVLILVQDGC
jgi:hypothetical protein